MDINIRDVWTDVNQPSRILVAMTIVDPLKPTEIDYRGMSIPTDAFEWRVAEYELDSEDVRAGAELIIMEPFLLPLVTPQERSTSLFLADTIAQARTSHLERISQVKSAHPLRAIRKTEARALRDGTKAGDYLDDIGFLFEVDPLAVVLKKKIVEKQREHFRLLQDPKRMTRATPVIDRVGMLRSRIAMMEKRGEAHGRVDDTARTTQARSNPSNR